MAAATSLALSSCTKRQKDAQCITGDQKSCPCLGGGDGVQVCQADGTYAACECLQLDMAALGGDDMAAIGDDMAAPSDLAVVVDADLARINDLSLAGGDDAGNCVGGTPDEDADGRANACDLCPDDPDATPVDTDGDGLPDACDPDPSTKTNALTYFDPLDTSTGHWSTPGTLIANSFMTLDTMGQAVLSSSNATDALPTSVRVQAHIFLKAIYTGTPFSDTGVFVGDNSNPVAANANGVLCTLHYHGGGPPDTLDFAPITNGAAGAPTTTPMQFVSAMYRLRVTNRAGAWTCEATANGLAPATVTLSQSVTGPLFISLRAENMESHVHAVSAESIATLFSPDVQADLDVKGCTLSACHGTSGNGSVMYVKPMATAQADIDANYTHVMAEINATQADQSPLLRKPLAGSGSGHAGGTAFASTSDPMYQRWLKWIQSGEPKQ